MIKKCHLIVAVTCKISDDIVSVAKTIKDTASRYVFVVDEAGAPKGVISTVDVNNRVVAEEKDPKELKAQDIMTSPIEVLDENEALEKAYHMMIETDRHSVPITREGKLIGIINFDEVLKVFAQKKSQRI